MFWAILENFGKIEKNESKLRGVRGPKSGLLRILESNFFLGPNVPFSYRAVVPKDTFSGRSFGRSDTKENLKKQSEN